MRFYKLSQNADAHHGKTVEGKISRIIKQIPSKNNTRYYLEAEFPNFSGSLIKQEFVFVDSKPELRRYELGNRIQINVDESNKSNPFSLKGAKMKATSGFKLFSLILLSGFGYGMHYFYSTLLIGIDYKLENLGAILQDTTMLLPVSICLGTTLFMYFIFKIVFKMIGIGGPKNKNLLYYGIRTTATINSYQDTNMTINDNPVVKFLYSFKDARGNTQNSEDKMNINRLEIPLIHELKEREIIYDRNDPTISKLMENFKNSSLMASVAKLPLFLLTAIMSIVSFFLLVSGLTVF